MSYEVKSRGCGLALALVRDLREHRVPERPPRGGKVTQPTDTRGARGCLSTRSLGRKLPIDLPMRNLRNAGGESRAMRDAGS